MLNTLLFLLLLSASAEACFIQGTDSGVCSGDPLDKAWRQLNMPFCGAIVQYTACLPKYQPLPPMREYPQGKWYNHTVYEKDQWVMRRTREVIQHRIKVETNQTLIRKGIDEYGDKGVIAQRFYKNPDCKNAYKNFMCWSNFPRCDGDEQSLVLCKSVCENYLKSCGVEKDLWRCGPSKYFNGYEPEKPSRDDFGNPVYLRDYYPGQPFRNNKFSKGGGPIKVCTPSIKGAAPARFSYSFPAMLFWLLIFAAYLGITIPGGN